MKQGFFKEAIMNRKPPTERQLAALKPTQWQPGQSGNKNGRPKKLPITDALRELLEQTAPGTKGMTRDKQLALVLFSMATGRGNKKLEALREILDRVEGKAVQRTEVSGPDGGAVQFETPGSREEAERRIQELMAGQSAK